MNQTLRIYSKVIPFAFKKRKIMELLTAEWNRKTEKFRKNRKNDYKKKSIKQVKCQFCPDDEELEY